MSEDHRTARIEILIEQKRYVEAENILKDLLSGDSNNSYYLYLLAEVNLQLDRLDQAYAIITSALASSPDDAYLFYVKSRIELRQDNYDAGEVSVLQSIALDPRDADYYAWLAHIKLARKQYQKALEYANKALEVDAENLLGLNTRSTALLKLNKSEESFETIEGALREDPNNAYTHANYGWSLLEKGNQKKALEHFEQALKNDPNFKYAQGGMLEALKANNPIYKAFLKYSFWMGNLTAKYQWGVLLGLYFGTKFLINMAEQNEALQPFLIPIVVILILVAFSTWIITPISNLFLRFNKYGQLLLDRKEKISSNFVAFSLGVFLIGLLIYAFKSDERFLALTGFGFAMMVPFSVMFSPTKYKNALLIYTLVMTVVGILAITITFSSGELFNLMSTVFIFGFVGFQWVANFLLIDEDNV
ncbi:MAG: tetratricopeptide repeat protein [Flavobacteriales bacterium]